MINVRLNDDEATFVNLKSVWFILAITYKCYSAAAGAINISWQFPWLQGKKRLPAATCWQHKLQSRARSHVVLFSAEFRTALMFTTNWARNQHSIHLHHVVYKSQQNVISTWNKWRPLAWGPNEEQRCHVTMPSSFLSEFCTRLFYFLI